MPSSSSPALLKRKKRKSFASLTKIMSGMLSRIDARKRLPSWRGSSRPGGAGLRIGIGWFQLSISLRELKAGAGDQANAGRLGGLLREAQPVVADRSRGPV